jgi:hypothetical protein
VQFEAPHNYNRDSREAVYAWMARWLQNAPADVKREERTFTADPLPDLLVFHHRPFPAEAMTAAQLTRNWIDMARRQLSTMPLDMRSRLLRLALGYGTPSTAASSAAPSPPSNRGSRRTVLAAGIDETLARQLRSAGFSVQAIDFTPFDNQEAEKIPHFDSYNRTAASQRVADIVEALRASPDAALVASGDHALAGLLATSVEPGRRAVLDVGEFDTTRDAAFVERLYMPGLRKAGDLSTAAEMMGDHVVIHNAGSQFLPSATNVRREQLTARDIIRLLRQR